MNVFHNGTDVALTIPLTDSLGNALDVASIAYRVIDAMNVEVVPSTAVSAFVASSDNVIVTVLASNNTLPSAAASDLRVVELLCTLATGNVVSLRTSYIIQTADPLQIGVNSFQTLAGAEFTATKVPNTPGWNAATAQDRIAAMIDARVRICQLNFSPLNNSAFWGQNSLNFVPEGSFNTPYAARDGSFIWGGNLAFLKPDQYLQMPVAFRQALSLAQLAEADAILGGDPIETKRRQGLMTDSIGESRQSFRHGIALDLPVSRRALSYLSLWITFNKKIAR